MREIIKKSLYILVIQVIIILMVQSNAMAQLNEFKRMYENFGSVLNEINRHDTKDTTAIAYEIEETMPENIFSFNRETNNIYDARDMKRYLIYNHDNINNSMLYYIIIEVAKPFNQSIPIVSYIIGDARLVIDLNNNKIETVDHTSIERNFIENNFLEANYTKAWDCLKRQFGITGIRGIPGAISRFCSFTSSIQTLLGLATAITACIPQPLPAPATCVAAVSLSALAVVCGANDFRACMNDGGGGGNCSGSTAVSNGNWTGRISISRGQTKYFCLKVSGARNIRVNLDALAGDPDLYTKNNGTKPTISSYNCRPYFPFTRDETCIISSPRNGANYFMIRGFKTSVFRVKATKNQ